MWRLIILLILCKNLKSDNDFALQNRIVGGSVAVKSQFPWQAALRIKNFRGEFLCGGTLISSTWVLTASHCVKSNPRSISVILGTTLLNDNSSVTVQAKKWLPHPESFLTMMDIALIQLATPVSTSTLVKPIKISPLPVQIGTAATVSGWGKTHEDARISQSLKFANLKTISNLDCFLSFPFFILMNNDEIVCAKGNTKETTCQGDSGGPLVIGSGSNAKLIGIVSFGATECSRGLPVGFTRVEPFKKWIASVTGILD